MLINYKISFFLRRSKPSHPEGILYTRITIQGLATEFSTGIELSALLWDNKRQHVKGSSKTARSINYQLEEIRFKIEEHRRFLSENNQPITAEILKSSLQGKYHSGRTILDAFEYHNQRAEKLLNEFYQPATLEKYKRVHSYWLEFALQYSYPRDLALSQLHFKHIREFDEFLRTEKHQAHNTAVKFIRSFKTIISMARDNDWMQHDPFKGYKESIKTTERPKLSAMELKLILDKELSIERIERVRDVFAFACFTGMSFSDMKALTPRDIAIGIDGDKWIQKPRTKSQVTFSIPLLPQAVAIIEKYKNDPYCQYLGVALPVLSNQKYNAYLKELADICGIDTPLTSHVARHTFATTVTLEKGVSLESVSRMLGHTNTKMTQHYAKVTDLRIAEEMKELKKKLS